MNGGIKILPRVINKFFMALTKGGRDPVGN